MSRHDSQHACSFLILFLNILNATDMIIFIIYGASLHAIIHTQKNYITIRLLAHGACMHNQMSCGVG
eukprot:m.14251 g.14251  ORF g.14251 m.14251 type:complete len:67 (-) comp6172_c0_seq1:20-220(-)